MEPAKVNQRILDFIARYCAEHGYGPTFREIGKEVGLASPATVKHHIDRLVRDGLVTQTPKTARTLRVTA